MRFSSRKKRNHRDGIDPDEIFVDSVSALATERRESQLERPIHTLSPLLFLFIAVAGICYLVFRAHSLQNVQGSSFLSKSQENRFLTRLILPPRGIFVDRKNKPLVENIPTFGLVFSRDAFLQQNGDLKKLLQALTALLSKPPEFFFSLGFPSDFDSEKLPSRILVTPELTPPELLTIAPRLQAFPGAELIEAYQRRYKAPYAFSHVLGFVGKTSPDDLHKNPLLRQEELIGKSGLEAFYDSLLRGKGGKKIVEVDASGNEGSVRLLETPAEGATLRLTVDGALQETIYDLLSRYTSGGKAASVVALDPQNGAIRSLVSFPAFDNNKFGASLTHQEYQEILANRLTPLFNRAISGEFPSGSTIKPLIAAAALAEKIIDPTKKIYDPGFIEIPNPYHPGERSVFPDWRAHGWVNFYDAIALSANVYFYIVGGGYRDQPGLGINRIKKYMTSFGLGAPLGIDLPGEKPGFLPDPSNKSLFDPEDPVWRIGDTYNVSIGQGGVEVTPLQMAALTATLANGGTLYRPHLLDAVKGESGEWGNVVDARVIREKIVEKALLEEVKRGMRQTVTAGTAGLLAGVPVAVAAKTGTAQAGSGLPHAWVIAFAPTENPTIAIVVMVEHAGEGSTVAVPIMRDILQWYFVHQE